MDVGPVIVIPTYWADVRAEQQAPGAYDHSTDLNREDTELDRCLASLENVDDVAPIVLLVVCPLSATSDVSMRVRRIAQDHPSLTITVVTNVEAMQVIDRVGELAPPRAGGMRIAARLWGHPEHGARGRSGAGP